MNRKLRFYLRGLGIGILVAALILIIDHHFIHPTSGKMTDAEVITRAEELGMVNGKAYSLTDGVSQTGGAEAPEVVIVDPTEKPTPEPTTEPSREAVAQNTTEPVAEINGEPAEELTIEPTLESTLEPTLEPTTEPTAEPTAEPTEEPTVEPTAEPTVEPTAEPTVEPTAEPTMEPTPEPSAESVSNASDHTDSVTITVKRGSGSETIAKSIADVGLVDNAKDFNSYLEKNGYSRLLRVGTFTIPIGADEETIAKILTGK